VRWSKLLNELRAKSNNFDDSTTIDMNSFCSILQSFGLLITES
jgi:hypothetical protein